FHAGWVQKQSVYDAEDRRIRADAKRERQHCNRREARRLGHHANAGTHILEERIHGLPRKSRARRAPKQNWLKRLPALRSMSIYYEANRGQVAVRGAMR